MHLFLSNVFRSCTTASTVYVEYGSFLVDLPGTGWQNVILVLWSRRTKTGDVPSCSDFFANAKSIETTGTTLAPSCFLSLR